MWLVKRKTRQRVSSSTPNNLVAEIASAGLSPQRSSYYVDKGFDAHTKGGTPGRLPLYIRGCLGGQPIRCSWLFQICMMCVM